MNITLINKLIIKITFVYVLIDINRFTLHSNKF